MKFRQLQYVHRVVQSGLNISKAAESLNTSQPGISQQIQALERELSVDIFTREKNRLTALTDAGSLIVDQISTILLAIQNIEQFARSAKNLANEDLSIVATYTQALYILPDALKKYSASHPNVGLSVKQCGLGELFEALRSGEADLALTPIETVDERDMRDIFMIKCREFSRVIVVPPEHPLLSLERVTIEDVAQYPLVMYEQSIPTRQQYFDAFAAADLTPNIVLNAINADVIKMCVEKGLGVAILPSFVFSPERDSNLRAIDASGLFKPAFANVAIHRKRTPRRNVFDFIQLLAPGWTRDRLERELHLVGK
ncbi:MAG: LysR substrate-binding domain-containing protein [Pseudomonadota bacterium]